MGASPPGAADMGAVGRGMARGAAWMVAMRLVVRCASLINMMVLARLLVPEDFGLIAMAMIFVGAVDIFSEFNFDVALIRKQNADRADYDTAWTLSIIRGCVVALILLALAMPAADLFEEPRLSMLIVGLSAPSLLVGFQNIGVVDFRKSLDFRRDFLFMASGKVAAVVVTIGLALVWQNYWALVGGMIGGKLWRVGASYIMHPFRPRLSLARWRELFAFTKWLLLHNILLYCRNRADRLVIGKMLGAVTLGVYTLAFDLANLVTSELMAPIRRALYPGYARIAGQPGQMRSLFVDIFALTLWIGAPIPIVIGLLAEPLVGLLLGSGWGDVVPITQLLVIAGFFTLLSSGSQPIYLATGRPEIQTMLMGLSVLLLLPALLVGVSLLGATGAAIALIVVQTLIAFFDIAIVIYLLKVDIGDIIRTCWRCLASLGLMAVSVQAIVRFWPENEGYVADASLLLTALIAAGATYLGCSLSLWRLLGPDHGPERHIWRAGNDLITALRAKLA
ncbi:MAG: lipopolysaccharide biosynthesis protein [Geminicoccaceae bacterium]